MTAGVGGTETGGRVSESSHSRTPSENVPVGGEPPTGTPAVVVRGVHRRFGDTRALVGASLLAVGGEIHAVVGENGSGKSTLAKIIGGVLRPNAGTVSVLGVDSAHLGPRERLALGVATVYQEVLVAEFASVADNVFLGADGLFREVVPREERLARTRELLRRLTGQDVHPEALVASLPLSAKQQVVIARALARSPRVLILDESTSALDLKSTANLFSVLEELKQQGVAILMVTHRIAELRLWADRATVLRDGETVATLTRDEISEARLLALMGAETVAAREHPSQRVGAVGDDVLSADRLELKPGAEPCSFALRKGEIVGVAGLEGEGQVEFVHALAGIVGTGGATFVHEQDRRVQYRTPAEAAARGVVYIMGDRKAEGIFPALSILENFALPTYGGYAVAGVLRLRSIRRTFDAYRESLSIRLRAPRDAITSLSGGNQQKVLIARWLAAAPRVIVLNDPTRGVDIGTKQELHAEFRRLAAAGTSIVFLSTEIDEFEAFCDRVIVFRDGVIAAELAGEQVRADGILAAMFGVASIDEVIAVEEEAVLQEQVGSEL